MGFWVNSSLTELRNHVTDGTTQFLPSVSFSWLVALDGKWINYWDAQTRRKVVKCMKFLRMFSQILHKFNMASLFEH